jgi:hypothetical protein
MKERSPGLPPMTKPDLYSPQMFTNTKSEGRMNYRLTDTAEKGLGAAKGSCDCSHVLRSLESLRNGTIFLAHGPF